MTRPAILLTKKLIIMSNETTNPEIYGKKLSLTPENLATFEKFKKEIIKEEKNILKSITILNKLLQ